MGIPVFFKTLITDYQHVIEPVDGQHVDNLFFDLNCLLHPSCASVKDGNEGEMINTIIRDIRKLIDLTKASFVYIAIDGPAPKAKMIQQRVRRLKSVLEEKVWDTNAITPGTKFMNKLNTELHRVFEGKHNIVLSDSLEPGEGEHKILQYLRVNKDIFKKKVNCIYGLDADLIMLAMVSGIPKIMLLREKTSFNIEQMEGDYLYLKIDALKQEIVNGIPGPQKQTVINDYIFICFLLGNDFIKNSPCLNLRYNGLTHITDAYKMCQDKYNHTFYLINPKTKGSIHWKHFKEYIALVASLENDIMIDMCKIRQNQHRKYKRIYQGIQSNKNRNKSTTKSSFPSEDIMRHKPIIFMDDELQIFQSDDWNYSYNLFTTTGSFNPLSVNELHTKVDTVCKAYIESLVWTAHYYFKECISQEWFYPYEFAPTLSDLTVYLETHKKVQVKEHKVPYTALEQLQFVFPIQSYHLCDGLDDTGMEPITEITEEYTLLKRYDWECHPIFHN
jgi:5'-3' exonuclease